MSLSQDPILDQLETGIPLPRPLWIFAPAQSDGCALGLPWPSPRGRETRHRCSPEEPEVSQDTSVGRGLQVRGGQAGRWLSLCCVAPVQQRSRAHVHGTGPSLGSFQACRIEGDFYSRTCKCGWGGRFQSMGAAEAEYLLLCSKSRILWDALLLELRRWRDG